MSKGLKLVLFCVVSFVALIITIYSMVIRGVEFGGDPLKTRLGLLKTAPNFKDNYFRNTVPEREINWSVQIEDMLGGQTRFAPRPFPQVKPKYDANVDPGLRAVWFGHASVLVEIDGRRVFFDPMLSQHAFPVELVAPERMNPPPLSLEELPKIDAVAISHDHYDHMDMKTIQYLAQKGTHFFVGLGNGAHLEKWGVEESQVHEMKWGDTFELLDLKFHCTEARHYSGRKSMSRDTLWASWVVEGPRHTVFHSGDSGYEAHYKKIGERFPNIDMSLIKVGDYGLDMQWQDIHMIPENSVQAHIDLGAKVMLPIHWGVFVLSNHDWNEPIERALAAAQEKGISMATPLLGQEVVFGENPMTHTWWREIE